MAMQIGGLPHALENGDELARRLAGRHPAVFHYHDGTLMPVVGRPEDTIISDSMRKAVRDLAGRCTVPTRGFPRLV
jgi:trehalose 6-phosphate phosphatase